MEGRVEGTYDEGAGIGEASERAKIVLMMKTTKGNWANIFVLCNTVRCLRSLSLIEWVLDVKSLWIKA